MCGACYPDARIRRSNQLRGTSTHDIDATAGAGDSGEE